MLDGLTWSKLRSKTGKYRLFQQRDDGFASFGSCGGPHDGSFGVRGTIVERVTDPQSLEMSKPQHNSSQQAILDVLNMVTATLNSSRGIRPFVSLLLVVVFAISYEQDPLYSSNQNTYFLHGLANAGVGFLKQDWSAQTTDPFPAFSFLVSVTTHVLGENAFYIYFMVILGIYIYSILGIARYVWGIDAAGIKDLSYFLLLLLLYSGLLVSLVSKLPVLWRFTSVVDPNGLLIGGVAYQYILGKIFQPSVFGVFIVFSVYSFLRDRPFVAVMSLAVAATFHATYLLSAAVLTCTYMLIILVKERDFRKVLLVGILALGLVMPVLIYDYRHFIAGNSDIFRQAHSILVDHRIPHHTKFSTWFSDSVLLQITVVVLSIRMIGLTRLFPVLLLPLLAAMLLTIAQVITGNRGLALLFPWRMSVFLIPIASSIILAGFVSVAFQIFNNKWMRHINGNQIVRIVRLTLLGVIILIGCFGALRSITSFNASRVGLVPSARFATSTFRPGDLYLIPPGMESFRLAARVPVFVDLKTHPYKATELVEWFNRIQIAKDFYAASADSACSIVENVAAKYAITHVVLSSDSSISNCGVLNELYRDADVRIYKVGFH